MTIETTISRPAISRLCHRPSVWLSGMTPLMRSIGVGQRGRRRHDQRRRRRQAERPDAADAEIRRGADGAIVGAVHALRHLARQQPAEDQAEAPRHERREHREQADVGRRAGPGRRHRREPADHRVDRRRRRHGVAGDDDHRHLHREGRRDPRSRRRTTARSRAASCRPPASPGRRWRPRRGPARRRRGTSVRTSRRGEGRAVPAPSRQASDAASGMRAVSVAGRSSGRRAARPALPCTTPADLREYLEAVPHGFGPDQHDIWQTSDTSASARWAAGWPIGCSARATPSPATIARSRRRSGCSTRACSGATRRARWPQRPTSPSSW